MLELVSFFILWPIIWMIISTVVNTVRVRRGKNIRDDLTAFLQGMILPPFAILGSLSPQARAKGQSSGMFWGGIVGTALAVYVLIKIT